MADIEGTQGDDTLNGTSGNDTIRGGAGNDTIQAGDGFDSLYDGAGDDFVYGGNGTDFFWVHGGTDYLDGQDGDDVFFFSSNLEEIARGEVHGGLGDDRLSVSTVRHLNDIDFFGGDGADEAELRYSYQGSVFDLDMGAGDDTVTLGLEGFSSLTLNGDITLTLGSGQDRVEIWNAFATGSVQIMDFETGDQGDVFAFLSLSDLFDWDQESNPFATGHFSLFQDGNDTVLRLDLDGAAGAGSASEFVRFVDTVASAFTVANFARLPPDGSPVPGEVISGSGTLDGTIGGDTITGSSGSDEINGFAGADSLNGLEGNDTIRGGAGNDTIQAGDGFDTLYDGAGDDFVYGGNGTDFFYIYGGTDYLHGESGDDTFVYSPDAIAQGEAHGGLGDDRLSVSTISYLIDIDFFGGEGADEAELRYTYQGSVFDLDMGAGDDTVTLGLEGFSSLTLNGDITLTLGSGQDRVNVFDIGLSPSRIVLPLDRFSLTITDFEAGNRGDVILLQFSDLIFNWDGTVDPFESGAARLVQSGEDTNVQFEQFGFTDGGASSSVIAWTTVMVLEGVAKEALTRFNFDGFDPSEPNTITGTDLGETIEGTDNIDTVNALGGDDTIYGYDANDILNGGAGNDALFGGADSDTLIGGSGADSLDGGAGLDTASYAGASGGVFASLFLGRGSRNDAAGDTYIGIEALRGSSFDDILVGRDGATDYLFGGQGSDGLRGNGGNDFLYGEGGNDLFFSGFGADTHVGGSGVDTMLFTGANAGVFVFLDLGRGFLGHAEDDTYIGIENVIGSTFGDVLRGDAEANHLQGRGGNDLLAGREGADILDGGDGLDTVTYDSESAGVTASLYTGRASGGDVLISIERLIGSDFNDILVGNDGSNDTLEGGAGNDGLRGNGGDDTIYGGDGDDFLFSGFGADYHDGGDGIDTLLFIQANSGVVVNLHGKSGALGHAAGDSYFNIENVIGSNFADLIIGSHHDNVLQGRGGDDVLDGFYGDDILIGGDGADRFVYKRFYNQDRIEDFTDGEDVIDLRDFGFSSFSDVSALAVQQGHDTVINFGNGDSIRLVDFDVADFDANDVMI